MANKPRATTKSQPEVGSSTRAHQHRANDPISVVGPAVSGLTTAHNPARTTTRIQNAPTPASDACAVATMTDDGSCRPWSVRSTHCSTDRDRASPPQSEVDFESDHRRTNLGAAARRARSRRIGSRLPGPVPGRDRDPGRLRAGHRSIALEQPDPSRDRDHRVLGMRHEVLRHRVDHDDGQSTLAQAQRLLESCRATSAATAPAPMRRPRRPSSSVARALLDRAGRHRGQRVQQPLEVRAPGRRGQPRRGPRAEDAQPHPVALAAGSARRWRRAARTPMSRLLA